MEKTEPLPEFTKKVEKIWERIQNFGKSMESIIDSKLAEKKKEKEFKIGKEILTHDVLRKKFEQIPSPFFLFIILEKVLINNLEKKNIFELPNMKINEDLSLDESNIFKYSSILCRFKTHEKRERNYKKEEKQFNTRYSSARFEGIGFIN